MRQRGRTGSQDRSVAQDNVHVDTTYKDEGDIEEILPLALALVVFDLIVLNIVFPGGFG